MTYADLVAGGALRTAEYVVRDLGLFSSSEVAKYVNRRFGPGSVDDIDALRLLAEARQSVVAASRLSSGQIVDVSLYGSNPSMGPKYSYTTIAELSDPLRPGRSVSIPYTVYSDQPLTPQQIKDQAAAAVLEFVSQPERGDSAQRSNIIRRDEKFASERIRQQLEHENPAQNLDIAIVSAYRNQ